MYKDKILKPRFFGDFVCNDQIIVEVNPVIRGLLMIT